MLTKLQWIGVAVSMVLVVGTLVFCAIYFQWFGSSSEVPPTPFIISPAFCFRKEYIYLPDFQYNGYNISDVAAADSRSTPVSFSNVTNLDGEQVSYDASTLYMIQFESVGVTPPGTLTVDILTWLIKNPQARVWLENHDYALLDIVSRPEDTITSPLIRYTSILIPMIYVETYMKIGAVRLDVASVFVGQKMWFDTEFLPIIMPTHVISGQHPLENNPQVVRVSLDEGQSIPLNLTADVTVSSEDTPLSVSFHAIEFDYLLFGKSYTMRFEFSWHGLSTGILSLRDNSEANALFTYFEASGMDMHTRTIRPLRNLEDHAPDWYLLELIDESMENRIHLKTLLNVNIVPITMKLRESLLIIDQTTKYMDVTIDVATTRRLVGFQSSFIRAMQTSAAAVNQGMSIVDQVYGFPRSLSKLIPMSDFNMSANITNQVVGGDRK
jgi:hypothetical protein